MSVDLGKAKLGSEWTKVVKGLLRANPGAELVVGSKHYRLVHPGLPYLTVPFRPSAERRNLLNFQTQAKRQGWSS